MNRGCCRARSISWCGAVTPILSSGLSLTRFPSPRSTPPLSVPVKDKGCGCRSRCNEKMNMIIPAALPAYCLAPVDVSADLFCHPLIQPGVQERESVVLSRLSLVFSCWRALCEDRYFVPRELLFLQSQTGDTCMTESNVQQFPINLRRRTPFVFEPRLFFRRSAKNQILLWAQRSLTEEAVTETALVLASVGFIGWFVFGLHQALQYAPIVP